MFTGTRIIRLGLTSKYIFDLVRAISTVVRCCTQLADMIDSSAADVQLSAYWPGVAIIKRREVARGPSVR